MDFTIEGADIAFASDNNANKVKTAQTLEV
jgi:hypothetical protein